MKGWAAAAVTLIVLALAPIPDQCDQLVFARANPGLCYPGPLGGFPDGGGGSGGGGLLGAIGRLLGGLTGGLL